MKKVTIYVVLVICLLLVGCKKGNDINKDTSNTSNKKQVEKSSRKVKELSSNQTPGDKISNIDDNSLENKWDINDYESIKDIVKIKQLKVTREDLVNVDVQAYSIKYISEGNEVMAYLALPTATVINKTISPCIIYNRDGYGDDKLNTTTTITDLASYFNSAVFATQYRGNKTSKGKDSFGGADINDVLKLIDICGQLPFIDMNRIYMTGVGRGGMMTYIAANKDKRIKKIAVKGGIADLSMFAEQRPDLEQVFRDSIGGLPTEIPTEYQNRSAVYWAGCIQCPVLLIHSRYDTKVNYSQATKMAGCLQDCSVPYQFITNENDVNSYQLSDFSNIKSWFELN